MFITTQLHVSGCKCMLLLCILYFMWLFLHLKVERNVKDEYTIYCMLNWTEIWLRKYNVKFYCVLPKQCIDPDVYLILKFDIILVPLWLVGCREEWVWLPDRFFFGGILCLLSIFCNKHYVSEFRILSSAKEVRNLMDPLDKACYNMCLRTDQFYWK
jgi:hypothetical protein